jgi:bifunctional UDP-N-acetylglucosamine pyrophosphorylase/glucosamine-1-phosphate N-acetyltransferase
VRFSLPAFLFSRMAHNTQSNSHSPQARAVILAAGMGTRMKSQLPKVLHPIGGKPLIQHCISTAVAASGQAPVLVVGHAAEAVRAAVGDVARYAEQHEQLGTGHAVLQAEKAAAGAPVILVTYGDMPLLKPETLQALMQLRAQNGAAVAMLTLITDNARGFGRIIRDAGGERALGIVEEVSCTAEQLAIKEVNVGVYALDGAWVWNALRRIQPNPRKGEYFLTDLVEIAVADGREVRAMVTHDEGECIGINTRVDLADAETMLRQRINRRHMLNGVTLVDPASTHISDEAQIGQDTLILPNTHIQGNTRIGSRCRIGPNTILVDTVVGSDVEIVQSFIEQSRIDDRVHVGPFAHFRPGAHVCEGAHVGNYAEIKNSTLGAGSHMGHFSYLGDATVGAHVNIGAGTITCNYDGKKKSHTVIGDGAFVGSDTLLVAPVTVGEGAHTGAGAVVTKDVPDHTLVVGVPARPIRKVQS